MNERYPYENSKDLKNRWLNSWSTKNTMKLQNVRKPSKNFQDFSKIKTRTFQEKIHPKKNSMDFWKSKDLPCAARGETIFSRDPGCQGSREYCTRNRRQTYSNRIFQQNTNKIDGNIPGRIQIYVRIDRNSRFVLTGNTQSLKFHKNHRGSNFGIFRIF